jgi:1-phosphofructokinase family hexose kinase
VAVSAQRSANGARVVCVAPNPSIDRTYDIDRLIPGGIHRPARARAVAGGKGINVARAAHALGADVVAVPLLRGHAGQWLADELAGHGIAVRAGWAPGETRTCISIHDPMTDGLTEFYESGDPIPADAWSAFEALVGEVLEGGAGVMTISGSLPTGAGDDALLGLCRVARQAGVPVHLDAHGSGLLAALAERPSILKLNAAEAAEIAQLVDPTGDGQPRDPSAAVEALVTFADRAVVVTRGREGAVVAGPDGRWRVGPVPVEGRYPVGSGDAFLAGLATALAAGDELDRALRLATGAGAANALVPGAGELDPAEARRIADTVAVTPV